MPPAIPVRNTCAGFAQDDFKFSKKLTLNLGVRWDLFFPDIQKYYHKAWVDYSVPNPAANNILGAFVTASPSDPWASIGITTSSARVLGWLIA